MKKFFLLIMTLSAVPLILSGQKAPTGNPKDFKVKTCLHSVGYSGAWRGQSVLSVDEFLLKAKELVPLKISIRLQKHFLSMLNNLDKDC